MRIYSVQPQGFELAQLCCSRRDKVAKYGNLLVTQFLALVLVRIFKTQSGVHHRKIVFYYGFYMDSYKFDKFSVKRLLAGKTLDDNGSKLSVVASKAALQPRRGPGER